MRVKEIMNKAVAVDHDLSLRAAAKIMSSKNIGSLVAVKDSKILGILTEKDIIRNLSELDKKVSSVMARKVISVNEDEEIDSAMMLMAKNKIRHLPVANCGKLVGIITATDIIANSEDLNEDFLFD